VSTATAIVVSLAVPLTLLSALDFTVSVVSLVAALAAPAGTLTFTHTSTAEPGATVGVVLAGVVQLAS